MLIVGLAPAAHGGNRTGRMFTGDRSGDILVATLHSLGLANQATSVAADDGLELHGVRFTAPVHCAPPDNKPTPAERDTCRPWLVRELELLCDADVTLLADRRLRGPYGLQGGKDGAPGTNVVIQQDGSETPIPAKGSVRLKRGARIRIESPGGGGWGRP